MANVVGGPNTIHANLEDLERGLGQLREVLNDTDGLLLRTAGWGGLSSTVLMLSTGKQLAVKTADVTAGLTWIHAETTALHTGVSFSRDGYLAAEDRISQHMDQILLPVSGFNVAKAIASGGQMKSEDVERLLRMGPEKMNLSNMLSSVVPGSGLALGLVGVFHQANKDEISPKPASERNDNEQMWLDLTKATSAAGLFVLGDYAVEETTAQAFGEDVKVDDDGWVIQEDREGSPVEIMENLRNAEESVAGEGAIVVTKVETEQGPSYQVSIPGTQFTGPDGEDPSLADWWSELSFEENPWGIGGLREAMTLESQHVEEAVQEALLDAGAEEGDAVSFFGYSQGGIHAANLASSDRMAETFDVQSVLTVGSPTGNSDVKDDVAALFLEHLEDYVTGADGKPTETSANKMVLELEGYMEGLDMEAGTFGPAHNYSNYLYQVEQALEDPEIAEELEPVLSQIAAGSTGQASSKAYTLTRQEPEDLVNPIEGMWENFKENLGDAVRSSTIDPHQAPLNQNLWDTIAPLPQRQ